MFGWGDWEEEVISGSRGAGGGDEDGGWGMGWGMGRSLGDRACENVLFVVDIVHLVYVTLCFRPSFSLL